MAQQQSPWLEGAYGWSFGEGGWNTGMDQNLLKFSFMFDRNIDSITASLPPAIDGQAHYLTSDNRLYFAVGTTYFSTPVPKWFTVVVRATGETHQFDGAALVQTDSPSQLGSRLNAVELAVASLGTAAFEDVDFFATQASLDVVEAMSASYTDSLEQDLASISDPLKGAAQIGRSSQVVSSVAELKLLNKTAVSGHAFVTGYYTQGDGGGGHYWYDSTDVVSVDDGGAIIVATDGGRWKLVITDGISIRQFGAKGDGVTDDTAAIQAALDFYPINEADVGIISPKGFANNGHVYMPRGRYKVTSEIFLRRGIRLTGESRESTQLISFTTGGVLVYHDQGRYHPDELVFENFSIWQDESVVATSGSGITVNDTGLVTPAALAPRFHNLTIEGTYRGITANLMIGASFIDCLISKPVSHGIYVEGVNSSTSTSFQTTYVQQSANGDGFYIDQAAYVSFISTASDSHLNGVGYNIKRVKNVSAVAAGAEANRRHSEFLQCEGINWNCFGVANTLGGIVTTSCRDVLFSGHLDGEVGTGIIVTTPTGPTTIVAMSFRGTAYAASPHNSPAMLTYLGDPVGDWLTTRGAIRMLSTTGPIIRAGSVNPEGAITAPIGSLFMRTDAGGAATFYVKQSGTGNTGWVAK